MNVRVITQPLVASALAQERLVIVQLSVARTLWGLVSQTGMTPGLQPRSILAGHLVNTGGVVSTVQLYVTDWLFVLLQPSLTATVKTRVTTQPLGVSACVTLVIKVPLQPSLAVTSAFTLASVGRLPGLQPRLLPVGTVTSGAVVSSFQVA